MRLWQRLFVVIAGVGALAVVAVLIAQQQAFRRGFVDYLNTLEAQRVASRNFSCFSAWVIGADRFAAALLSSS